jgi:hypothetical protein
VKPTREEPIHLITGNHGPLKTLNAFIFCLDKWVTVLTIPHNTSHRLQSLDLTSFGPLKTAYNRECDLFMKVNEFEQISSDDVASLSI